MSKQLKDLTVTELKAALFDTDQQVKQLQNQYSVIIKQLEAKIKEEQEALNKKEGKKDASS